jgi:hypothetical protein
LPAAYEAPDEMATLILRFQFLRAADKRSASRAITAMQTGIMTRIFYDRFRTCGYRAASGPPPLVNRIDPQVLLFPGPERKPGDQRLITFFYLVVTVCALTGECSDTLLGVYQTEADCYAAAAEQSVKGECFPVSKPADDQQPAFRF